MGLRDRGPARGDRHGHSHVHDRAVTERGARLARYRQARERVRPRVSLAAFEALVAEALDELPEFVQQRLENVAVLVERWPDRGRLDPFGDDPERGDTLLGLYEGINRLERTGSYHLVTPDRITLFWRPIVEEVGRGGPAALRREVRKTVIHEVAHHFGYGDDELERLGG